MLFNIAQYLPQRAKESPDRLAVVCKHAPDSLKRTYLTFAELNAESDALAWGLSARVQHENNAIKPGDRVLHGVRPGLEFITITFALFKLGAVPILIDPGMGKTNALNCVKRARPDIAIAPAFLLTLVKKAANLRNSWVAGKHWFNWLSVAEHVAHCTKQGMQFGKFPITETQSDSLAAILFTSGGTGIPKGVCYEHGMFGAQVEAIRDAFKIEPGEIDLPAFPLFALFSVALGTTCVIPAMDSSRPAQCDPDKIIDAIRAHAVTYSFGSPAIWKRVGPRCVERGLALPSLKRILMAGAPVRADVLAPFPKLLSPSADVFIPYGATEALPVSIIRGSEVLNETWALTRQGKGHCVGKPLPGMSVQILDPDKDGIGEIAVSGPVVTKEYFDMPDETAKAKLTLDGKLWHRMGDMGYIDAQNRLWFCGRKAHRVISADGQIFYSVCCEAIFEAFVDTRFGLKLRAALAAKNRTTPVLVIESPKKSISPSMQFEITKAWQSSDSIKNLNTVLFYPHNFPVDVRHNAKINREQLSQWASSPR